MPGSIARKSSTARSYSTANCPAATANGGESTYTSKIPSFPTAKQVLSPASRGPAIRMPGGGEIHGPVSQMIEPDKLSELYGVPMRWVEVKGPTGGTRRAILPAFSGTEAA